MSICEEAVAMNAHGKTVTTNPISVSILFGLFKLDSAPELSNVVKPDHRKNRERVDEGIITSWGEHGRVAIVTNANGLSAAFSNHEIDYK